MKNLLLSNINIGTLLRKLSSDYQFETSDGYNGWIPYIYNRLRESAGEFQNIFILLDGYELFTELETGMLLNVFLTIREIAKENSTTSFWISDMNMYCPEIDEKIYFQGERYKLDYLDMLMNAIEDHQNINLFPLNNMINEIGMSVFYSPKMWYLASAKYSGEGESLIRYKIESIVNRNQRKKCLILDMDNTLWGGVIGEIGYDQIEISARFQDFQRRLKEIKDKGTVLAIISKNNYDDAITAFQNRDMILQEDDFVHICANWGNKAENLINIVEGLNIGLDSVVFIDDNPIERENIRLNLPQVTVPEFPVDTSMLNKFAVEVYNKYFFNPNPVDEDNKKTAMYRDNVKREEIKFQSKDLSEYIKQLKIVIHFRPARHNDIKRIYELSSKTNQYNTTTVRYTEHEFSELMNDKNSRIYVAEVSDKIGNNGLCIACVIKLSHDNATAIVEDFFMSCRIMGRKIENVFFHQVVMKLQLNGIKRITGYYIPTNRNIPAKEFFPDNGFVEIIGSGDRWEYELDMERHKYQNKYFIEVVEHDS